MTVVPLGLSASTRRSILFLSFATFSSMASQRICDAMLPELSRVFAVSLTQAAQVISVFAMVYGVLQVFYGPLGDRLGKFRVIAWATLGCSVGNGMAVFATSLDMLLLARMVSALGAAAIIPLGLAWIGDVADPGQLQETIARVGLGTALGISSGQFIGGLLTDTVGWRWAFAVLAGLFFVVGALLLVESRRQQVASGDGLPGTASDAAGFATKALVMLRDRWTRTVLLVGVVEGLAGFGMLAIWATHLHGNLGLSLAAAGAVVALFGVGGLLYMGVARHLIRRFPQRQLAPMGATLVLGAALLMGFTPVAWLTIPASLLAGFGFFGFHNVMQANAAAMAPAARGTAVSMFAASLFFGQSVGVQAAAALSARIGAGVTIALGGAILFVLGLVLARALRRRDGLQGGQ